MEEKKRERRKRNNNKKINIMTDCYVFYYLAVPIHLYRTPICQNLGPNT